MSPKKGVKALYDTSLELVIKRLLQYIRSKLVKINFFNDYEAAAQEFLSRCQGGREFIEDYFVGPLR